MNVGRQTSILLLVLPALAILGVFTLAVGLLGVFSTYTFAAPPVFFKPTLTLVNYLTIYSSREFWLTIGNTFEIGACVTLLTLFLSYPVSRMLIRSERPRMRKIFLNLIIADLFISSIVRAFSWIGVLGSSGLVNYAFLDLHLINRPERLVFTQFAVIIGITSYVLPFGILTLSSTLRFVGADLEEASSTLGANKIQVFRYITFPLSIPSFVATGSIVLVISLAAFVAPVVLGGGIVQFVTVNVYDEAVQALNYPLASAISVLFTALSLAVIFLTERIFSALAQNLRVKS
jgi:putative spermidine/putrescine transport system permease protein